MGNGVCKSTIVNAIVDKKLFTLDEVRAHTKASSSCGSCTGLAEQLIAATLGGDYSDAPKKKPKVPRRQQPHHWMNRRPGSNSRRAFSVVNVHAFHCVLPSRRMERRRSVSVARVAPES